MFTHLLDDDDPEYVFEQYGEKEYLNGSGFTVLTDKGESKITRFIRHKCCKKIYRIVTESGFVDVTEDHSLLNSDGKKISPKDVSIGDELLHIDNDLFFSKARRYNDWDRKDEVYDHFMNYGKDGKEWACTFIDKIDVAEFELWMKEFNKDMFCHYDETTDEKFKVKVLHKKPEHKIVAIYEINKGYDDWVYDLETENHHFHVGPGRLVVHNTDSVFLNYIPYIKKLHGDKLTDEEMMKYTLKYAQEGSEKINMTFKKPQNLEYEKIFFPFCIFSKKRYVGNKYEFDLNKFKQTSMGIVLKRRDNAPIVKKIYGRVIDIILNERDVDNALKYFVGAIKDLLDGNVNLDDLKISKSTRAEYANPTQIAHKVLADRMGERDPGNKPQIGDRIDYCYIDEGCIKCFICEAGVNPKNCKCRGCNKAFCKKHLDERLRSGGVDTGDADAGVADAGNAYEGIGSGHQCKKVCRFCRKKRKTCGACKSGKYDECNCNIKKCSICLGWYCDKDMKHHDIVRDNLGNINPYKHKCKKPINTKLLQGDLIENPSYITEKNLDVNYRYYLEHQIKTPVLQIFELVNDKPEEILADLELKYDNKKKGNIEIGHFFDISVVKSCDYKEVMGSGISKKFDTVSMKENIKAKHKKRLKIISEKKSLKEAGEGSSVSSGSLDATETVDNMFDEASKGKVDSKKKIRIKIKKKNGEGKGKKEKAVGEKDVEKAEMEKAEGGKAEKDDVSEKVKRMPPKDKASIYDFGHKMVSERDGRVYIVSGVKRKVWKLVDGGSGVKGVKNSKQCAKIKLQHKIKMTFGKL